MSNMPYIPRYWYCEPMDCGPAFEVPPTGMPGLRPEPTGRDDGSFWFYDEDSGEIYCEAILMVALPWPRFRTFSSGQQVVLSERVAKTFEWLQEEFVAAGIDRVPEFPHGVCKCQNRTTHFRVQCMDVIMLSIHCDCAPVGLPGST